MQEFCLIIDGSYPENVIDLKFLITTQQWGNNNTYIYVNGLQPKIGNSNPRVGWVWNDNSGTL